MKPRLVPPTWRSKWDIVKERDRWQKRLDTELDISAMQKQVLTIMRDWKQKLLDDKQLWYTDRKEYKRRGLGPHRRSKSSDDTYY